MNIYNPNYGRDHPNSPSSVERPDDRTDHERLKDAVERHLSNRELLDAAVPSTGDIDVEVFRHAEAAFMDSGDELDRLLEDITLISATKLRKALSV